MARNHQFLLCGLHRDKKCIWTFPSPNDRPTWPNHGIRDLGAVLTAGAISGFPSPTSSELWPESVNNSVRIFTGKFWRRRSPQASTENRGKARCHRNGG